ncbi:MAG TPA: hypothetical protein VFG61_05115 [Gaiellaceae bacterium]|nr:hypothetical protein [Gaiellaceae bacterium]
MNQRGSRIPSLTGIAAVALWVVGLVVSDGLSDSLADNASDQQVLAWVQGNTDYILSGGWLFMLGSLVFLAFAGILHGRMAEAGASGSAPTIAFGGAVAGAVFGLAIPAGDVALAINKDNVSASSAGALHTLGDAFFVGAELAAVAFLVATAIVILRTAALPRLLAYFGILVAVVLVIGPVGWAGLIFGLPVWTLWASIALARRPRIALAGDVVTA